MMRRWSAPFFTLAAALAALLVASCAQEPEAPGAFAMDQHEFERWEIALVEMRIEKNEAFSRPDISPLPAEALGTFEGLNYYFPIAELRFMVPLEKDAGADTVMLAKRKGGEVPYVRHGRVTFRHGGRNHRLAVFGPVGEGNPGDDRLWLPFSDASNGSETYPGGRYLDLTADADGLVDLDFNYAYNPYCDYDEERWNCTLPPPENSLAFRVEAGEKRFSAAH